MDKIILTKELYLSYSGKCQLYFPVGSEGQLLNLADMILEGAKRPPIKDVQAVIEVCKSYRMQPAVVEGQLIPLDSNDYERKAA